MGPILHVRAMLPVQAPSSCPPLPPEQALPAPRTMGGSDALTIFGPSFRGLPGTRIPGTVRASHVLDASLHAYHALRGPNDRPSGSSPQRFLCGGFWCVKTIAVGMSRDHGAVSRKGVLLPGGLRGALWTRPCVVRLSTSFTDATLGTGGW